MYTAADRLILFFYGSLSLARTQGGTAMILGFYLALVVSCLQEMIKQRRIRLLLCLGYVAASMAWPQIICFLPLISYDFLPGNLLQYDSISVLYLPENAERRAFFESIGLYLFSALSLFLSRPSVRMLSYVVLGFLLALILQQRTLRYQNLLNRYQKTRDDDTELQILLKERSLSLLEKQNSEIYAATLRERNRIAREIHDNVGHMLTRSILMVGALKTLPQNPEIKPALVQLEQTLKEAMDNIRNSVHDLHESSVNLKSSLESLIQDFTFCPVSLQYEMSDTLSREVKYSLISITKEALVNISRHSNATSASVTVVEHPAFYQYVIQDNGSSAKKYPEETSGLGLNNMKSRIAALNGQLYISTDNGFRIYITIPKPNTIT